MPARRGHGTGGDHASSMREQNSPIASRFARPVCWTEARITQILSGRDCAGRKAAIDALIKHRKMMFNPDSASWVSSGFPTMPLSGH